MGEAIRVWLGSPLVRPVETFAELFDMAEHGTAVLVARSADYPWGHVFGGQVAAQGLWAAASTVDPTYAPHSLHAYFIRGGRIDEPIRYEVDRIRDGRSFVTRRVVARQSGGAILNLSASFHVAEDAPDVTRLEMPDDIPGPDQLPIADWSFMERRESNSGRALSWLRIPGGEEDSPLWQAVAHTFASDDLPTEAAQFAHPLGRDHREPGEPYLYMGASLDHAIWFHRLAPADQWVLHDFRSCGVYGARGMATGELWSADGVHIATVAQEVLLRAQQEG